MELLLDITQVRKPLPNMKGLRTLNI